MTTWNEWVNSCGLTDLQLDQRLESSEWAPTEADRKAAWKLYVEMRTRIVTRPLHLRSGDEETALASVHQLFPFARNAMTEAGTQGRQFTALTTAVLNQVIRPLTAKWHKRLVNGRLAGEDDKHEFRCELELLQQRLGSFQTALGRLAEGDKFVEGSETGFAATVTTPQVAALDAVPFRSLDTDAERKRRVLDAINPSVTSRILFHHVVNSETAKAIQTAEAQQISRRRAAKDDPSKDGPASDPPADDSQVDGSQVNDSAVDNVIGLAISGGGIRSATFALGVLQRLGRESLLREVDYLSTVSGGGYVGSFVSSYLNSDATEFPTVGLAPNQEPFGETTSGRPGHHWGEPHAIRHLRNHSKYLLVGGFQTKLRMAGLAIYGLATNMISLLLFAALVGLCVGYFFAPPNPITAPNQPFWNSCCSYLNNVLASHILTWIGVGMLALTAIVLPLVQNVSRNGIARRRFREWFETRAPYVLLIATALFAVDLLPLLYRGFVRLTELSGFDGTSWVVLAAVAPFAVRGLHALSGQRKLVRQLVRLVLVLSGPLVYLVVLFGSMKAGAEPLQDHLVVFWVCCAFGVALLLYSFLTLNVNFTSPHRFYRNRLSEAYLIRPFTPAKLSKSRSKTWHWFQCAVLRRTPQEQDPEDGSEARTESGNQVTHVDVQPLSKLRANRPSAPYHLINGAVNVPGCKDLNLRGRESDFFLFSQEFCGSPITSYYPTEKFEAADPHLDLGTAMAISGAAASPHAGTMTQDEAVFIMTLLNIRLGYWLRNPKPGLKCWNDWLKRPSVFYLWREMFGSMHEDSAYINVSDGGHIENLGVYELLRRRCKFIVAIDGEHDPKLTCFGLHKMIRLAEIDFGIQIHIRLDDLRLDANGLSQSHFAIGAIDYGVPDPPDPTDLQRRDLGFLLYLKSSLTGNEGPTLFEYKAREPAFPHHSTADQFFDEEQFESYRSLGFHVADQTLRNELFGGNQRPTNLTTQDWFQVLCENLLPD